MHASALFALSVLPAVFAQADDSSASRTSTASRSSPSSADGLHIVKVGDGGITFQPAELKAAVGDVVEFHFYKGTHSVAQSSFDDPCEPLNSTSFFSGEFSVTDDISDQVFSLTIKSEEPMWYYCATGQHCQGGMVGVINAPSSGQRTLERFTEDAADADNNIEPSSTGGGKIGPAASGSASGSASASASASSTSGSAAEASSSESAAPNAGLEARGDVRWGLMGLGLAMAGFFGGLMI
ncbi:hypothetical protein FZEAL_3294 [Fusarium zealandicum]|uniref:Phytocyanin domain-containing protein n=1 Tax=Fusarium zealandicum TaxID=1053134 RepID=A0A8H4XLY1_9HYPO|nr:hypothetical protein FZEAL_3294 [Fusarium zealandicum]